MTDSNKDLMELLIYLNLKADRSTAEVKLAQAIAVVLKERTGEDPTTKPVVSFTQPVRSYIKNITRGWMRSGGVLVYYLNLLREAHPNSLSGMELTERAMKDGKKTKPYDVMTALVSQGLVQTTQFGKVKNYRITDAGLEALKKIDVE